MTLISLRHSRRACHLDLALYGLLIAGLSLSLTPPQDWSGRLRLVVLVWLGLALWSLIEYLTHRYVLHGLQPFQSWHARHHARPAEHMGLPTWLSMGLFGALVYAPLWAALGRALAHPLMIGVLSGYLVYSLIHHASHHGGAGGRWLERHRRWHALHHQCGSTRCYGVSSSFWDRALGSHLRPRGMGTRSRSP